MSESRDTPQGTLRVATLSLIGELLTPVIAEFLLRQPRMRVEVSLAEAHVDLIAEEYDLALRTGPLADSALVARRLGHVRTGYYASPAYLSGAARSALPRSSRATSACSWPSRARTRCGSSDKGRARGRCR